MRNHSDYKTPPIGQAFGRLTVIGLAEKRGSRDRTRWKVRCSCGAIVDRAALDVAKGITQSCGCLQRERATGAKPTHGMSQSSEYRSWSMMKDRCTNQNSPTWSGYGGRGITVCKRWMTSFHAFLADMGPKPSPARLYSIGRKDNDGDYEPSNCVWQTAVEQRANRRDTKGTK